MYRRILVPVDGSSTSKLGLQHALGLAKDQHARVHVLNVVDELAIAPMMDGYPEVDMSMLIDSMRATGEEAIEEGRTHAAKANVEATTAIVDARGRAVSDVILDHAKKCRADLIVMGTHGRRGLNRLLLGSDAERVLRKAPVPVLLVRGAKTKRRSAPEGRSRKEQRNADKKLGLKARTARRAIALPPGANAGGPNASR
jgi:nucleotide-binding universal stress UspA family protein